MESLPLDAAGHRRSPATMPGYHRGRPPRNKGEQYPADPRSAGRSSSAGKGGKRREVGMDRWAWVQLEPWLETRRQLPIGALLCVIHGATAGRHWEASAARESNYTTPLRRLVSGDASRHTNFVMPTQSRWFMKAFRSS
jgi:hypothetical protein